MKRKIIIRSDKQRREAEKCLSLIDFDDVHEIIIRPFEETRRLRQLALYWAWVTIICDQTGNNKLAYHFEMKKLYLLNIFIRDDKDFSDLVETVRSLHKQGKAVEAKKMAEFIISKISTSKTKVKQMAEFMRDVESHAWEFLQIVLPHPENQDEWDEVRKNT